jgi:non-ribosomal peptide synthetase component F
LVLSAETHSAIADLAARTGTSVYMVLHAAFAVLLHRHGAGDDLPVGALVAGRTEDRLAGLIGGFANTLVLRTTLDGDPTFTDLLARVRESTLGALGAQEVPYGEVAAVAGLPEHGPQVMVVHHEQPAIAELEGGLGTLDSVPTGAVPADLALSFYQPRDLSALECYLGYATDLFDQPTAQRLAAELHQLIERAVAAPDRPVADLSEQRKENH